MEIQPRQLSNGQFAPSQWEHFSHDADVGIRGFGPTMEAAFSSAALALTAIVTDPKKVKISTNVSIRCKEADPELLFLDFINAVIYEMDTRQMIFGSYEIEIKGNELTALIGGELVDVKRHDPAVDVKGATVTELQVVQEEKGWRAQCVVDV